jgi:hypothetical protein
MRSRLIPIASFLFLLACSAFGQSTTITGTIDDLTLNPVTSGKVVFTLKPSVDTTISGNARFTPGQPVTCYIQSNGTLLNAAQTGACTVVSNTALTPAGTSYRVDICPYMACSSSFNFYAINSTYSISTIVPTPTTGPAQNFADVFSNQTIAGNKTFTGTTNLSGAQSFSGSTTIGGPTYFSGCTNKVNGVLNATCYSGGDIGAQINNAYASSDCAATGCHIFVPQGSYPYTTPILFGAINKPVWLECSPGSTFLNFQPLTGNAITLNWGDFASNVSLAVAHPGVYGCVVQGLGSAVGGWGTAVGIADGANAFGQEDVIDGVTIHGFDIGVQFNNAPTFLVDLVHSIISFNFYGVKIESNDTEKNHINNNNISDNVWAIYFDTSVGSGDWYIDNNSLDSNTTGALFVSASGLLNDLQVNFDDNHIEDNGSGAVQDIVQVLGGTVNMHADIIVIDHTTGGPYAENILVSGSSAAVTLEDVMMHSFGSCGSSPCVTTLATFNSQATGSLKNVTITSGTGMTRFSAATGTQVTDYETSYPQFSVKPSFGLTTTLGTGNTNSNFVISNGSTAGIIFNTGSYGILLNGPLQNFGQTAGGTTAYTSTIPITTQVAGMPIWVQMNATNTGAASLNVNGLGSMPITKNGTTATVANDLLVNEIVPLISDGSHWQIVGAATVP